MARTNIRTAEKFVPPARLTDLQTVYFLSRVGEMKRAVKVEISGINNRLMSEVNRQQI